MLCKCHNIKTSRKTVKTNIFDEHWKADRAVLTEITFSKIDSAKTDNKNKCFGFFPIELKIQTFFLKYIEKVGTL